METEMKISSAIVRRLRNARGWSQDQLATASGLSLRTIQRIESEGVASTGTRVSLAATFGIALADLAEEAVPGKTAAAPRPQALARLLVGLAVFSCAMIIESARLPTSPMAEGMLAINLVLVAVAALMAVPALLQLARQRNFIAAALAFIGMPLVVLLVGGLLVAALRGHAPTWPLLVLGLGGMALVLIAVRDSTRPLRDSRG